MIVAAEGEKCRTNTRRVPCSSTYPSPTPSSSCPITFNDEFIFHARSFQHRFVFELWEQRPLKDRCLARTPPLDVMTDNDSIHRELSLLPTLMAGMESTVGGEGLKGDGARGNGELGARKKSTMGKLAVEISSYDDPMYL